jgi:uncharacterized protein (TIGR04376 family)
MGLFDDFNKFLETQLEEYLRNNPHLELLVLEDKLQEQADETLKLMTDLKRQEKQLQDEILALAREVQLWYGRVEKAKAAGRVDLAEPAEEHQAGLLRQGNQKWGQMEVLKQRISQTQELQGQIQARLKEVQQQVNQFQANPANAKAGQSWDTGWSAATSPNRSSVDALEYQFKRWEAEEELDQLKRNSGH